MKNNKGKNTRVAIGVPSNDMVYADFAMSLVNMTTQSALKGLSIAVINQKSSLVEVGRSEIVDMAKQVKADYLFYLDTDMVFPSHTLLKLLSHKKDIVCCDALRRREPFVTVVETNKGGRIDHESCDTHLIEVKGVSGACTLINMEVFEKIEKPYFHVEWLGNNTFRGEDYYFSKKAIDSGFKVYCDVKLSQYIGHIGVRAYYVPRKKEEKKIVVPKLVQ